MKLITTDLFKNLSNSPSGASLIELDDNQLHSLQSAILSIADDVVSICEKNNFSYHLTGGTALGAVRHNGFIPWDDDMDIDIERKDYNKLLEILARDYSDKYDIHNPYSMEPFSTVATNIRLKNTVVRGCNDVVTEQCGASLDLVVIENTYNNKFLRNIHGGISLFLGLICSCRKFYKNREFYLSLVKDNIEAEKIFRKKIRIGWFFSLITLRRWNIMYDCWNRKCHNTNTRLVTVPTGRKHFFGELYERKDFCESVYGIFENRKWKLPKETDKYLKKMYGDYMKLPPENQREKHVLLEFKL